MYTVYNRHSWPLCPPTYLTMYRLAASFLVLAVCSWRIYYSHIGVVWYCPRTAHHDRVLQNLQWEVYGTVKQDQTTLKNWWNNCNTCTNGGVNSAHLLHYLVEHLHDALLGLSTSLLKRAISDSSQRYMQFHEWILYPATYYLKQLYLYCAPPSFIWISSSLIISHLYE